MFPVKQRFFHDKSIYLNLVMCFTMMLASLVFIFVNIKNHNIYLENIKANFKHYIFSFFSQKKKFRIFIAFEDTT